MYSRFSPEDQRDFDRYYAQWVDDSRRNRDDAARDADHMQDITARYNIPANVPPIRSLRTTLGPSTDQG